MRAEASVGLNLREEKNSILSLRLSFNDAKNSVERQSHSYEMGPSYQFNQCTDKMQTHKIKYIIKGRCEKFQSPRIDR